MKKNVQCVIRSIRMSYTGQVACVGNREMVDKCEGNSPHGRPRHRWLGENKLYLK
jgi:hypothetical protein